jgi:uncharacterized protein YkwD
MQPRCLLLVGIFLLLAGCSPTSTQTESPDSHWYTGTQLDHASSGSWIDRLNRYRVMAGVAPLTENRRLSAADRAHARYLVKNFEDGVTQGASAHGEMPGNRWYTIDGDGAAHRSDIALRKIVLESPMDAVPGEIADGAVDEWIAGPFHRVDLLDPSVTSVGWGSDRQDDVSASVLEVQRNPHARMPWGRHRARPVMFPPPGSLVNIPAFPGGEWPDPLAACPGYYAPSGLPITIQFGPQTSVRVGAHSLTVEGAALEHCVYDASDYSSRGEAGESAAAVHALQSTGAVVIVPRDPMAEGRLYAVSIDINGRHYGWTFRVGRSVPSAPPPALSAEAAPQNLDQNLDQNFDQNLEKIAR